MSIMTQRIQWTKPAVLMCLLVGLSACGGETRVTRIDAGVVTDLSGRWNDTDSRIVAESMVKEALEYPWLNTFSQSKRRQPVVVVGTVLNSSHEHINVHTFVDLERELTNFKKSRSWRVRMSGTRSVRSAKNKRCMPGRIRRRHPAGKSVPITS